MFAELLEDSCNGLLVLDSQLRIVHSTRRLRALLGLTEGLLWQGLDLQGFLAYADLHPDSRCSFQASIFEASDSRPLDPVRLFNHDRSRAISMLARSIGSKHLAVTLSPLDLEAVFQSQGGEGGSRDPLTELLTRSHFETVVRETLKTGNSGRLAILLIDLDRFKPVNDTLGHAAGDALLRLVAQRLQSCVRDTDLVARLGGDEFAFLLGPIDAPNEAAEIARRIVDLVGRTYLIEGQLVNVGASLGIAIAPTDGDTFEGLLKCADLALYHSKTTGRGAYNFFSADMEVRAQARRTNELDLRRALALKQLEVHYQPQVDIKSRKLLGFEALVRWRHPDRGLISPGDFLPMAEEIGVMHAIGEWVLKTACREARNWPEHVLIAVNASPTQFETGRFAQIVSRALSATQLAGNRLEIEITEGVLLRNEECVLRTMQNLRAMGVRIAMDDFGTGYASLSQLARFSFDKIKIDRSLVGPGGDSNKHRAIVRAIASLGESLGVTTMAEGVETSDQLDRIQSDGCESVQGYLFSRPVPAGELEKLLADLCCPFPRRERPNPVITP